MARGGLTGPPDVPWPPEFRASGGHGTATQCTACLTATEDLAGGLCRDRKACEARIPPLFGALSASDRTGP